MPSHIRQQGAVLMVSLILLLVMTLLGIAAIDLSQLQSQMARNSLLSQYLHQIAYSEIQAQVKALADPDYLDSVTTSTTTLEKLQHQGLSKDGVGLILTDALSATHNANDDYTQSGAIAFIGNTAPPSGYSLGSYVGKNYEIYIVAESTRTQSTSKQTQGLSRIAPLL